MLPLHNADKGQTFLLWLGSLDSTYSTKISKKLPFTSVHEFNDQGKISLWRDDYWDLNTLMSNAPAWWIEKITEDAGEDEFGSKDAVDA